jgi:hypothetical protein
MPFRLMLIPLLLLAAAPAFADSPDLAFKPAGDGLFEFDTGALRGRLKVDSKYQGLYPLVDAVTGEELTNPPGVFSFYRVFTAKKRYGNAARDWATQANLLADGAVEVRWPPAEQHPLEITAVYRWTARDTLDLRIAVRPERDMPNFELFMSSYFTNRFRASVYLKGNGREQPKFVPADKTPDDRGGYVMFPKDQDSLNMILDGRWTIPPSPVDWTQRRWLAAPAAIRRDRDLGLTALMMCPPDDCFAVASPWNPTSPDARGYRSLYLSLFGQDLQAAKVARASCRLTVRRNLSDDESIRCYQEYVKTAR